MVHTMDSPLFFFKGYGDHRDLPSSPTRRSPDLFRMQAPPARLAAKRARCRPNPRAHDRALRRSSRSEEHTSELQSRQYLVCRLLLEKKKKKTIVGRPKIERLIALIKIHCIAHVF